MSIERYSPKPPAKQKRNVARHAPRPSRQMPTNVKVPMRERFIEPPIGAVLAISGKLHGSVGVARNRVYDYAIIRASNGRWYTTGSTCPTWGYTWEELKSFIATFINPTGERLR